MAAVSSPITQRTILILVVALAVTTAAPGRIIYVDDDAAGANDGKSWADAHNHPQDALVDANESDKPVEIWVAQGLYKPDQGTNHTPGDREATFRPINGVSLKGGFAGLGGADPDAWDVEAYETILSGDLADNDVYVNDLWDLLDEPTRTDNSFHVVTATKTDATAVLEGFMVIGGYDNRIEQIRPGLVRLLGAGAGIIIDSGSPTISNCTFKSNVSNASGGGMYNYESSPTVANCSFSENWARKYGGGIKNRESSPTLLNCTISDNTAGSSGGGMRNISNSNPVVTGCTFSGNSASFYGGGIYNYESSPTVTNCTFRENSAEYGGGIKNGESSLKVTNCAFVGNSAWSGGGIFSEYSSPILNNCTFAGNYGGGILNTNWTNTILTNCILWDGGNEITNSRTSTTMITYSNVQGGFPGEGNIDADPLFANPGYWAQIDDPNVIVEPSILIDPNAIWVDGDYHLKSEAGRYDLNSQSWVQDDVTSPCIDAGDPNSCLGFHEPYPNGLLVNMGAYSGTAEASMSLSPDKCNVAWWAFDDWVEVGEPVCWCYRRQCQGDADCKSQGKQKYWVSTNDLDVLIAAWNKPFAEIEGKTVNGVPLICADFNQMPQGKAKFRVSTNDLDILIHYWQIANGPAADCP